MDTASAILESLRMLTIFVSASLGPRNPNLAIPTDATGCAALLGPTATDVAQSVRLMVAEWTQLLPELERSGEGGP